ncbi:S-formylglutathione hydrolase [bacterium (Candidatus Blackallbacteria) CG17_big_fil_post_rev_8_21_14_2_50_48_46]|uniref:S-formylglutathione hydrolase n=1 Tax=bacterium (Candidatus Blackallbacteria) CG17_big_fil_post_rev_8_21_14_2_50_48_46 TaxID=2014261 RepID=A0A2M7G808_9BACT|nr:MAG: S-formylglutathione hydrolase [bacterium (Candidatus Blackallbacteria) CG18_big_fil_WC_8_21_14_2_50_49_26]PIW18204.1 MAG: S-formylglutathione hydrolase [bacterium (Candidatus Blackallbacteria) CG17_big_fil_post_rev_8_21_14_2_50_48_46]PIW50635.1 MAG: S-formylglutathione hydrolase [bacterium (Candidatus Blackallbacteria) CG13_big_fil_rev_8_21_14_2_50_49_14]
MSEFHTGSDLARLSRVKAFGGWQETWLHSSESTGTSMKFGVYLPPQADDKPCPVVYWLSGLTCTEENFILKAGAQRYASELGLILVSPDTSPRGAHLPGEDDSWDFGTGAGFYLNATEEPWNRHYRMYDYVLKELPAVIEAEFLTSGKAAIAGHSMGGHGALVLALRNPERYTSVSAFAPICAPSQCAWGYKAFSCYLGSDPKTWEAYDAHLLIRKAEIHVPTKIDQGSADQFLAEQLKPELLEQAAHEAGYPIELQYREGYDHSYFFISTFIGEHLHWHADYLKA